VEPVVQSAAEVEQVGATRSKNHHVSVSLAVVLLIFTSLFLRSLASASARCASYQYRTQVRQAIPDLKTCLVDKHWFVR
jgi:hypothetical protein